MSGKADAPQVELGIPKLDPKLLPRELLIAHVFPPLLIPDLHHPFLLGSVLELVDELGRGSFARVFLAEQEVLSAVRDLPVVVVNPTAPVGPGDWKPTPTGRIIVDFMRGRMLAYVRTGLNLVPVEDDDVHFSGGCEPGAELG